MERCRMSLWQVYGCRYECRRRLQIPLETKTIKIQCYWKNMLTDMILDNVWFSFYFLFFLQLKFLMSFGYLPQSDLETGNLRTEDQVRDAIKTMQVIQHNTTWGWISPRLFLKSYTIITIQIFFKQKFVFTAHYHKSACLCVFPRLSMGLSFIWFSFFLPTGGWAWEFKIV